MMDTGQRVEKAVLLALQMHRKREKRLTKRLSFLSFVLCCCLICVAGYFSEKTQGAVQGMNGAVMLLRGAGGYVLVGVVCFVAAAALSVLCLQLKEKNKKSNKQIKENEKK